MPSSSTISRKYTGGVSGISNNNTTLAFTTGNYLITATGTTNGILNSGTIQFNSGNDKITATGGSYGILNSGTIQFGNDCICDIEYCRQGYDSSVVMSLVWMRSLRRNGSLYLHARWFPIGKTS